jgi:hypothetical protein
VSQGGSGVYFDILCLCTIAIPGLGSVSIDPWLGASSLSSAEHNMCEPSEEDVSTSVKTWR